MAKKAEAQTAAPLVAKGASIAELAAAANACRACPIGEKATQVVFGEGPVHADVLFVGEQPGDQEDKSGHPFVGPAGKVFDRALDEAGIDRARAYVTNAVKHFKWEPRGKRRIHAKPIASEIRACKPWLEAEIERVKPRAVCVLGATAAQSLLGAAFRVTERRGERIESDLAPIVMATVHPSSILRARDDEERGRAMERLVADLKKLAEALAEEA
jgi:DNA polymerase